MPLHGALTDCTQFTRIQEIVSKNEYVSLTHAEKEEEEISSKVRRSIVAFVARC